MLTRLNANVSINQTLPIRPNLANGISPKEMQKLLDKGAQTIKDYLNDTLLPSLESSGAENIGAVPLTPESGDTVSDQLTYILGQIQGVSQGGISDGSVTASKLAEAPRTLLERDIALTVYDTAGTYTFTAPLDGNYLVCLVGGGGGRPGSRKRSGDVMTVVSPPTAGGVSVKLVTLEKDSETAVTVGEGGAGSAAPDTDGVSGTAANGGTTSFGNIFSATGGNRGTGDSSPFNSYSVENTSVGTGVNGDINLKSGTSSMKAFYISGVGGIPIEERSTNLFSSGFINSLNDENPLWPGGAPGGAAGAAVDGANGGCGAAFILYLGPTA